MSTFPPQLRRYDAVVVGTGLGGSTLACRLAERGIRVLVLDKGDSLPQRAERGNQTDIYFRRFSSVPLFGGLTKFYGAAMYRMRESDFRATQHEMGESPAWPISYADLEPYYCEAETLYRVHGSSEGDPTEPPRSAAYPFPPLPHAEHMSRMVVRLRESGHSVSAIPRALDYGPDGKCKLCPKCDGYYCQLDAKRDADVSALRPALASGNVDLLPRTECVRILTNENGTKATGVLIQQDGNQAEVHAEVVAIGASFAGSPEILLRSRTSRHPHGIGNSTGCVGRFLGGHSTGILFPMLRFLRKLPPMHSKTFCINNYYEGSEDWKFPLGVIQAAGQIPLWEEPRAWWKKPIVKAVAERSAYFFYMTEALPTRETGFQFDGEHVVNMKPPVYNMKTFNKLRSIAVDIFKRAGYRVIAPQHCELWHEVGTARIGADPESSVLDSNCKVHGLDNLYVVDASALPSAGAVNTGLTIAALALRAGDTIAGIKPPNLATRA